ncbi:hypothetical protein NIZ92_11620 [Alcaligenes sp. 1735tsa3]|uniref:hypothetical protein n=1 Tax=Alcaligenes TaxID=507 RepID=UPI001F186292|nr:MULTISPECIES: hypothetical protein [Alcaligenes]MBW4789153.1 hypothetical protein [Alcaligenes faecalis subsp. faecalis]USY23971.1 hypothetical protein NIZ92_11620 [Alcaligenes sp. 1735tsa3]
MTLPLPQSFYACLSDDRLQIIADHLLKVRHQTMMQLTTELDDNWVRETACFGRSRNLLISLATDRAYPWLGLINSNMDVTPTIDGVPFRFFRDDVEDPSKAGFFRRNAQDNLFAEDPAHPVMWRFIIDRAMSQDQEDRVVFAGYNVFQEKVSEWSLSSGNSIIYAVGNEVPPATPINPATVDIWDDIELNDAQQKASNDK